MLDYLSLLVDYLSLLVDYLSLLVDYLSLLLYHGASSLEVLWQGVS